MKKCILFLMMLLALGSPVYGINEEKIAEVSDSLKRVAEDLKLLNMYYGPNKAYFVMHRDVKIYSNSRSTKEERSDVKELLVVQRGDTLLAGENTKEYIESHRETGVGYLPVVYKGVKGYVEDSNVRPLLLEAGDTVYMIQEKPLSKLSAMEKSLLPFEFKVINIPVNPMMWIWVALGGLGMYLIVTLGSLFLPKYFKNSFVFILLGCAVTSCAEILYLLSMPDHELWFFYPKAVGWGLAIVNFLLTCLVLGGQYWIFAEIWANLIPDKDLEGDPVPHWIGNLFSMPAIMAIITIVMIFIDAFTGNTWGIGVYASVYGIIVLAGLAAMGYLIAVKRPWIGIMAFVYYLVASIGLTVCLSILGLWIVVLAVLLIVVVIAGGSALAIGKGVINGAGETVTGYTESGKKVTGVKDINGNVRGYDGKTYRID